MYNWLCRYDSMIVVLMVIMAVIGNINIYCDCCSVLVNIIENETIVEIWYHTVT